MYPTPFPLFAAAKKDAPTAAELSAIIESKIMDYGGKVELEEIGKVLAIGDGIARCASPPLPRGKLNVCLRLSRRWHLNGRICKSLGEA